MISVVHIFQDRMETLRSSALNYNPSVCFARPQSTPMNTGFDASFATVALHISCADCVLQQPPASQQQPASSECSAGAGADLAAADWVLCRTVPCPVSDQASELAGCGWRRRLDVAVGTAQ
jgi:hypothetical protein